MSERIIDIDGSSLEGGGQILRMALAFSALLRKPIRVFNIRAGRSTPGLRPQHLAGVNLVKDITQGSLSGASIGSTEITFHPGTILGGRYLADPGTAGSVMLLFQVSFPCLLFADKPSELHLRGGTNADMAPQIDHTLRVFKPVVEKFGAKFNCKILKRGYFPKGGGEISIQIEPCKMPLQSVELLNHGNVSRIDGLSFVAGVLPMKMSSIMADAAARYLKSELPQVDVEIKRVKETPQSAEGNGSGIIVVAETDTGCLLGGSALGKRGVTSEEVGEKAAKELLESIRQNSCVDSYVQDQLIIFMALARGISRIKTGAPTLHTKTAIFVSELMTNAKFNIKQGDGLNSHEIECEGIGLQRS